MKGLILIFVFLFCMFSMSLNAGPADLLPADNEVSGWVKDANTTCYSAGVSTSQGLYDVIDGGAGLYIDRGFLAGAFEGYTDGSKEICFEIYDQGSAANALDLYEAVGIGDYQTVNALADSARLDTAAKFFGVLTLELLLDRYFIRIPVYSAEDAYVESAKSLAQTIINKSAVEKGSPAVLSASAFSFISYPDPAQQGLWLTYRRRWIMDSETSPACFIYTLEGRLVQKMHLTSFGHSLYKSYWNGLSITGSPVAAGYYLAVIKDQNQSIARKITIRN